MRPSSLAAALCTGVLAMVSVTDARAASPPIVATMPHAARVIESDRLDGGSTPDLLRYARVTLDGLLLDIQQPLLDSPEALHQAISAACAVQLLAERGEASPDLRLRTAYAAFVLHEMGWRYETDAAVKARLDALPQSAHDEASRQALQGLVEAVSQARAYASTWFPEALALSQADAPQSATHPNLHGLFLHREGRLTDAIEELETAIARHAHVLHQANLYRVLVDADREGSERAAALLGSLTRRAPGLVGALRGYARARADAIATRAWEALSPKARAAQPTSEQLAQATRFARAGQTDAALALLEPAAAAHPEAADRLAELLLLSGRHHALHTLLEAHAAAGPLRRRLVEIRLTATTGSRISVPPGPFADQDLDADLTRFVALGGDELVVTTARLMMTVQAAIAAAGSDGEVPADHQAAVRQATTAALTRHPDSVTMLELVAGAWITALGSKEAVELLPSATAKAPAIVRAHCRYLVARLAIGLGVRHRDAARLAAGARQLEALAGGPEAATLPAAELAYWRAITPLAEAALSGKQAAAAPLLGPTRAALAPLVDTFDLTDEDGRTRARAVAASLAATAFAAGDQTLAHRALQRLQLLGPGPFVGLAAGMAAVVRGALPDAARALSRSLAQVDRPTVGFLHHKWLALVGHRTSTRGLIEGGLRGMLATWDQSGAPDVAEAGLVAPIFAGDFVFQLTLGPGEPLRPHVRALPMLVLLPDFQHDRSEVQSMVESLGTR